MEHGGEVLVVIPAVKLPDVLPVQEHLPLCRVVKAAQQLDEGGFSRAVASHNGQLFPGTDGEINMGEGIVVRAGVPEAYIPQRQLV